MRLNRLVVASILGLAFMASTSAYACEHGGDGDSWGGGWSFLGWCHHGNHEQEHHGDCDHHHDGDGGDSHHHDCNPTKGYNGSPCSTDGGSNGSGSGSGSGSGAGTAGSGKGISG